MFGLIDVLLAIDRNYMFLLIKYPLNQTSPPSRAGTMISNNDVTIVYTMYSSRDFLVNYYYIAWHL